MKKRVKIHSTPADDAVIRRRAREVLDLAIAGNFPFVVVCLRPVQGSRPIAADAISHSGRLAAVEGSERHWLANTLLELSRAMAREC